MYNLSEWEYAPAALENYSFQQIFNRLMLIIWDNGKKQKSALSITGKAQPTRPVRSTGSFAFTSTDADTARQ